jgi:uncharacterized protein YbjT (DUF2867 family)
LRSYVYRGPLLLQNLKRANTFKMVDHSLPRKLLVFGATGLIGRHIIQEVYNARSSFETIGFFTSNSTANDKSEEIKDWKEKGVEVIVGDVNSEQDVAKACTGVFCFG